MKNRYMTPLGWYWFLERPGFRAFMAREATSVAVAGYLVFLLILLHAVGDGPAAYDRVVDGLKQPLAVFGHVVVFGAALYHSITWFNLTPKIMPMYIGEDRLADVWAAILMGYLPWLVVSAVVLWAVTR